MTEEEKRLHHCCFTGHRPEKLQATEDEVKQWLEQQIDAAMLRTKEDLLKDIDQFKKHIATNFSRFH